ERQFSLLMSASVSVISSSVRTIMCLLGRERSGGTGRSGAQDGVERLVQDGQAAAQLVLGDGQRRQQLDDLAVGTRGLDQQTVLERVLRHPAGELAVGQLQTAGEAATLGEELVVGVTR